MLETYLEKSLRMFAFKWANIKVHPKSISRLRLVRGYSLLYQYLWGKMRILRFLGLCVPSFWPNVVFYLNLKAWWVG